jgi:cell wall-associated NlpC family hydrolase
LLGQLGEHDIAHPELGQMGFQEAQNLLEDYRSEAASLLARAEARKDELSSQNTQSVLEAIVAQMTDISAHIQQIRQLAKQVNTPDFPSLKKGQLKYFRTIRADFDSKALAMSTDLRLRDLEHRLSEGAFDTAQAQVDAAVAKAESASTKIEAILNAARTRAAQDGVDTAVTGFGVLQKRHRFLASCWFGGVVVFGAAVVVAVSYSIFGPPPEGADNLTLVAYVFKRVLAISAPLAGMRMCLSKFNLERNLQIVYDHRQTVLNQYPNFDRAIAENEAKNQFRLEVAKFIFSDPDTGYVPDTGGAELNINPVIGAIEKATSK